jgi:hypothetical protein
MCYIYSMTRLIILIGVLAAFAGAGADEIILGSREFSINFPFCGE